MITIYIIFWFLLINVFVSFYKIFRLQILIWMNKNSRNKKIKNKYIFLVPWYKEQSIVKETIEYYKSFFNLSNNIELIFITSSNEEKGAIGFTTKELLEEWINEEGELFKKVYIIENTKAKNENKAKKINYALSLLRKKYDLSNYIVGVFDFDARISLNGFLYLDSIVSDKYTLFQFVPKPILTFSNLISYTWAIYHLKRVFWYEFNNPHIEYCMGASMFIKWSYLKNNDITEPIDDISLWYRLIMEKVKKITLPHFTEVTIPSTSKDVFNQMIPVYFWVFSYFRILKGVKKYRKNAKIIWILIYLRILLEYITILLFFSLFFIDLYLFFIIFWLYLLEWGLYIYTYNKLWKGKISFLALPLYIAWIFLRISLFIYYLLNLIFKFKNIYKIKTVR